MNDRSLTFAGGAGTVTGSKYLLACEGKQVLLDCGLFQGLKALRLRNWGDPPFVPADIDAVILSHAHLDHCGYLPILVRRGFAGPVYCTPATAALARIVLEDAAHLQEEDARRANARGYSKHHPALPLFTTDDARAALTRLQTVAYGQRFAAAEGFQALFRPAGHILGAASVELDMGRVAPVRLVFSGDLGRWNRPILRDPELVPRADVLLLESTYGGRTHQDDPADRLVDIVTETVRRRGVIVVPSFAVGRAQELLWAIRALEDAGRLPQLPVFLDSPMAIDVTSVYCDHPEDHDLDMRRLTDQRQCPLCSHRFRLVRSVAESKALASRRGPMVVIAGSGMATGGRVLHHLARYLPDSCNTVLLPGFQAAGTRGRSLQDGASKVRIHGQDIAVKARIEVLDGLSAHADQADLLRWLRGFVAAPSQTYIVHGEPQGAQTLAETIRRELAWTVTVAADGEEVALPDVGLPASRGTGRTAGNDLATNTLAEW